MVGPVVQCLNVGGLLSVSAWAPHADSTTEICDLIFCFRLVHASTERWIGIKVCLAQCPSRYLLSDTLQLWYSLNELFARSVLKSDPDIRDTLWCPIYTYQKEKPAVWLHDGAVSDLI